MIQFEAPEALEKLEGKVVVVTGGGNGVGAGVVELCVSRGAAVCIGDVAVKAGQALLDRLGQSSKATFVQLDVSNYDSVLNLFDTAMKTYGRVDYAISCAGLVETPGWFDLSKGIEDVRKCPSTRVLDVNLTGSLYFSEIAIPYLRHNKQAGADKSIILISSIAGFLEAPGLPTYAASKHGVLGLMRSLRHHIYPATGIRVNAFCPNAIATAMTAGFSDAYRKAGISVCEVPDTAGIIMQVACEGSINGKAFYLEGGRAWDIDEPLGRLMPQWLGERQCDEIRRGGEILMSDPSVWNKGAEAQAAQSH